MLFDAHWFIAALMLFLGCTIQTAIGFGMAVVAAPILVIMKPEWVPYILTVVALFLSMSNAWQQRHQILWKQLAAPVISRVPGTLLGTWLLLLMPIFWLQIAVASMVMMTVVVSLWLKPFQPTTMNMGIAGFVSGVTGTTTSIGGPPLALVLQHSSGATARANLSIYFVYSCILSLVSYGLAGLLTKELLIISMSFIPIAIVGFFCGRKLQHWVDNRFRPILLSLCSLSAMIVIVNAFIA